MTSAIFTAGIVLLLNIWGGKRSGLSTDPNKEMADVHKAMKCLKSIENGWHTAGRLWDILYELASVGDLALPTPSPQPQKKRERDSDFSAATSRSSPASSDHGPRAIAGSRRVSKDTNLVSGGPSVSGQFFNLPLHSEELGRLPLHGQVNFFTRPEEQQHQGPARSDFSTWYGPSTGVPADHQAHGSYAVQEPSSFYDQLGHALNGHSLHAAFDAGPSVAGDQPPSVSVNMPPGIDTDTMAMWSNAPAGFEMNDWGAYLANELNHGMPPLP